MAPVREFASLPPELVLHVLDNLDYKSIARCTAVCKFLRNIIAASTQVQYAIELGIAGHEDGRSSSHFDNRLTSFRRHQNAWDNLEWTSESVIPMYRSGYWELCGNVHAQTTGELRSLTFQQIPSELRGIKSKEWSFDLDFPVRDFSMDPSQDLLVVIQSSEGINVHIPTEQACRIHLLQLSTGKPHPKACRPAVLSHIRDDWYSPVIAVCGRLVGVLLRNIGGAYFCAFELIVWDWTTGIIQAYFHGKECFYFSFLSEKQVLLACADMHTYEAIGECIPSLVVADISVPSAEPTPLTSLDALCVLNFPELSADTYVVAFHLRSDLTPPSREQSGVPFHKRRNDRLFVATLWLAGPGTEVCTVTFIPSSTISSCVASLSSIQHADARRLSWEEWGPAGTRMCVAPPCHSDIWVCYVSGLTYSVAHEASSQHPPAEVHIYDFNQDALRYRLSRSRSDGSDPEGSAVVLEPTEVPPSGCFRATIRTSLPYILRSKQIPPDPAHTFRAVVMAEDAIVLVCNIFGTGPHYRILSF